MKKIYLFIYFLTVILILFSCGKDESDTGASAADTTESRDKFTVLIRNSPTTYYIDHGRPTGFEYDMVKAMADSMGKELELKVKYSVQEVLDALENGEGELASAAITRTDKRDRRYIFTHGYHSVQQQVIYMQGKKRPRSMKDLKNYEIVVNWRSSYDERLVELKENYPELEWKTVRDLSTEQILQKVWEGEIELTIADNNIYDVNRRYFPGLQVAFPITDEQELSWVVDADSTRRRVNDWLDRFDDENKLALLRDKYYSYVSMYDFFDLQVYHERIDTRLPKYESLFKGASEQYDISWSLLAAQGYQESHWNPRAKSPTGVRGIMMLTLATAKELGVQNRLDPRESIFGGAKYMDKLYDYVPESIVDQDTTLYALAAYNVGIAHMWDARKLARRLGRNPNTWQGIRKTLPLLSNPKYYKTLRYGYARGTEPVRYVERIQNYRSILVNEFSGNADSVNTQIDY